MIGFAFPVENNFPWYAPATNWIVTVSSPLESMGFRGATYRPVFFVALAIVTVILINAVPYLHRVTVVSRLAHGPCLDSDLCIRV
jgi:hypothetical protein